MLTIYSHIKMRCFCIALCFLLCVFSMEKVEIDKKFDCFTHFT